MPNNKQSIGTAATDGGREAIHQAHEATERFAEGMRDAAKKADGTSASAADGLDTVASAIHDSANDLPGGQRVQTFAHATADQLSAGADYIRTHDAKRLLGDVESFVKNNPGPALAAAAAIGFLVGRALSRN